MISISINRFSIVVEALVSAAFRSSKRENRTLTANPKLTTAGSNPAGSSKILIQHGALVKWLTQSIYSISTKGVLRYFSPGGCLHGSSNSSSGGVAQLVEHRLLLNRVSVVRVYAPPQLRKLCKLVKQPLIKGDDDTCCSRLSIAW